MCVLCYVQLQEVRSDIGVVEHSVMLSNSPGLDGYSLTIHNMIDVSMEANKVQHDRCQHGVSYYRRQHGVSYIHNMIDVSME